MIIQNIRRIMRNKYKNYCIQLLKNLNSIQEKKLKVVKDFIGKCVKTK